MNNLSSEEVDLGITGLELKLAARSDIAKLYPGQRQLLHEFCKGKDIFYTGNFELMHIIQFHEPHFKIVQMPGRRFHHVSSRT